MKPETELQGSVGDLLRRLRVPFMRVNSGVAFRRGHRIRLAPEGTPDWYLYRGGLWVEWKRPGIEPAPNQVRRHAEIRDAGDRVVVVSSAREVLDLIGAAR